MAEIQRKVVKQSGRKAVSQIFQAKNDKDAISAWKLDLNRILHVFNVRSAVFTWPPLMVSFQTELVMNIHVTVSDMRDDVLKIREEISGQVRSVTTSRTQSTDGWMSPVAVVQTRSAASSTKATMESSNLHPGLLDLESHLLRLQGRVLDVTS